MSCEKEETATPVEDAALIQLFLAGDSSAFEILYLRYRHAIFLVAYHEIGNTNDADDVVQDTFLSAYRSLGKYPLRKSLYAWLRSIAMHMCHKLYHKNYKLQYREKIENSVDTRASPLDIMIGYEGKLAFSVFIQRLPPQQRKTLILRLEQQMSFKEIGKIIGCSEGAARAHMFYAVRKITAYFALRDE